MLMFACGIAHEGVSPLEQRMADLERRLANIEQRLTDLEGGTCLLDPFADWPVDDVDQFHDELLEDILSDPLTEALTTPVTTPDFITEEIDRTNQLVDHLLRETDRYLNEPEYRADNLIPRSTIVVDEHLCTDEYMQALALTTVGGTLTTSVPALWDGTPFVVDVSSTFWNAEDLLDTIAEEAGEVRAALGYEVFVAGEVLPLPDVTKSQIVLVQSGRRLIPPDQRIEIRCCDPAGGKGIGGAAPWFRIIMLEDDAYRSRHAIIHELYHILGFTHPGEAPGVVMSYLLMSGSPTSSTSLDLAKLACIYD